MHGLVQGKGFRVPVAHPHPKIYRVPRPGHFVMLDNVFLTFEPVDKIFTVTNDQQLVLCVKLGTCSGQTGVRTHGLRKRAWMETRQQDK